MSDLQNASPTATPSRPAAGAADFVLLGESLALDLANTRIQHDGRMLDLISTTATLGSWLHTQRPQLSWRGRITQADLRAVHLMRQAIDDVLEAFHTRHAPPTQALGTINQALSWQDIAPQLRWANGVPRRNDTRPGTQRHVLLKALAFDIVQILTGPQAGRVRKCAHPDCRLQFVAHNPRRLWCSGVCGNRARVARHYLRHSRESE